MKYTITHILSILLLPACLSSCYQAEDLHAGPAEGELATGLYFNISAGENLATRAINEGIANLYAIYFQDAQCTGYANLGSPVSAGVYRLTGYPTGSNIEVVFIANLSEIEKPPTNASIASIGTNTWKGKTFAQVSEGILKLESADNIWQSSAGTANIPMYAHAKGLTLPTVDNLPVGASYLLDNSSSLAVSAAAGTTYKLVRMVARVEIINNLTGITSPKVAFNINSAWVENGQTTGYICYDSNAGWTNTLGRVTAPTLYSAGKVSDTGTKDGLTPTTANGVQNLVFYLFETGVVVDNDITSQANCHIVLEGKIGNDTDDSQFMLPIPKTGGTDATPTVNTNIPGPVLRNHNYTYTITGVENVLTFEVEVSAAPWVPVKYPVDLE